MWILFGDDDVMDVMVDVCVGCGDVWEMDVCVEDVDELVCVCVWLVEVEMNVLWVMSVFDVEWRRREEERARTRGLILVVVGCVMIEMSVRDDFGESVDVMGGMRMVLVYVVVEWGGEWCALECFVERVREGKTASEGGVKMMFVDVEVVLEDFRMLDVVLEVVKLEVMMWEVLLVCL